MFPRYPDDMPRKLQEDEDTVSMQVKLPSTLKRQALELSQAEGDGDLSSWIRGLIRREWKRYEAEKPAPKRR
jgi:hypothetical protein